MQSAMSAICVALQPLQEQYSAFKNPSLRNASNRQLSTFQTDYAPYKNPWLT